MQKYCLPNSIMNQFSYGWYGITRKGKIMCRLSNSDAIVTQLWNPIILRNPEDGDFQNGGSK
jgi:hypothetical protein